MSPKGRKEAKVQPSVDASHVNKSLVEHIVVK